MKRSTSPIEEVKLIYTNKTKYEDRPKISSSNDAARILKENWDLSQISLVEECKALFLDRGNRLMSIADISKGGMSEAIIDPRIVFTIALKRRSHNIILAHNHPSGNLRPSKSDIELTKRFNMAGDILRIQLLDHLIITDEGYYSLTDNGDIPALSSHF